MSFVTSCSAFVLGALTASALLERTPYFARPRTIILISVRNDAIVVAMLARCTQTLDSITDYTKQPDGSWHADLYRPIRLHVEGRSPDDCRYQLSERFDLAMVEWLERVQNEPAATIGTE